MMLTGDRSGSKMSAIVALCALLFTSLAVSAQASDAAVPKVRTSTDINALQPIECGRGPEDLSPRPFFVFEEDVIRMPEGVFLLIRKGRELGALRFTRVFHGDGLKRGDATAYESYFQGNGSGSLLGKNVHRRTGTENMRLDLESYIPYIEIERGHKEKVRVGPWKFGGLNAGDVEMNLYGTKFTDKYEQSIPYHDPGFEFAPTSARDVKEIDAADPHLLWFRYVERPAATSSGTRVCMTRRISVPVTEQPK